MKAQFRRSINTTVSAPQYAPDRFVNREEEENLVKEKVKDLIAGQPVEKRAITFTGERGTGKTWLLAHLKTLLAEFADVIALLLNLKDYGGIEPPSAVARIIREVNRATGGSDRELGVELPEMSRKLMERLKEVLAGRVLVLLLDHVHESDWDLLLKLEDYLLGPLITMPEVLIVMSGR
ncbi:MAG TPA: ATP-binding protein, partial [Anaerolineae bacterium]|nr:ATP-binding protein [Anaerolineae bacterium]